MKTIRLTKGLGENGKSHCVMAATSIVAEEPFTDKPKCVCPTITFALICLNDSYEYDTTRELALGHLPWIIIGTRGTLEHELKRAFLFADWAVRVCYKIECEPIIDQKTAYAAAAYSAVTDAHAAARAAARDAAASAAANAAILFGRQQDLIAYIESTIIPVYTTMPVEQGFRIDQLITSH